MKTYGLLSMLAILGLLFVFSGVVYAASTWSQTGGPENGKITNIIVDPINSDVIIAGTVGDGVYKSTDQGATWQQINSGLPGDSDTYLVSMDPINSSVLYVGTVGAGIFKSTDGGESWRAINTGLTNLNVHMAPAIDPTDTSVLYVGTEGSVFKSTNGGTSWSESNNGLTEEYEVCAIAVDPSNSSIVYAGMSYDGYNKGGIFKSTDAGRNWLSSSIGLSTEALKVNSLTIDPEDSQTIYVTADNGVIKSVNSGESWEFINNGLINQEVYGLAISPLNSEILLVGTWGGGVFHTVNGGETWVSDNNGLFNLTVIGIAFDTLNPTTLYAGTYEDGVFKRSYSYIGPALTSVEETTQYLVTEIYVATFGRAPANAGLNYWADSVDTGSFTIDQVAQSFFDQPETKEKFPEGSSNSEFITTIYYNVLKRAPAESGLTYWVDALDSGTMRRDQAIMAIINGAKAATGGSDDAAMLAKKTEIGVYFANSEIGTSFTADENFMDWATNIISFAASDDFNLEDAEEYISNIKGFTDEEISGKTYAIIESPYNNCTYDIISFTNDHQLFVDDESDPHDYNIVNGSLVITGQYGRTTTFTPLERKDSVITVKFSATGSHFEEESGWGNIDFSNLNNSATALKDWFITNGFRPHSTITADGRVTNTDASFDGRWWIENNVFIFDYPEEGGCVDTKAYKLINNRLMFATDADYTYTFTMSPKN